MSETWARMLAGAAARGARVQVIAPDGETMVIVSGPQAAGLVDLFYMMARTT